jgi:hypothetical protein
MHTNIPILFFTITVSLLLSACNNNDTANKLPTSQQIVQKYAKETNLTGRVSNKKGNIRTGEVKATDGKNKLIASTQVNKDSHYSVSIPAGTLLPVTLSFSPTPNSSDKEKLISVVIYSSLKKYDINDLTTLIAKKAKSLGGYSHSNMSIAADSTVGIPDANKTSTGFRGDPTKQYGGWH